MHSTEQSVGIIVGAFDPNINDVTGLLHCYALPQSSNTSSFHKMACSHHIIGNLNFSLQVDSSLLEWLLIFIYLV